MNGKQLKNSILQWAIQGKLVPQDASEEPAIELLKRIRNEKARLVKEGKIKKDKNESVIFRGEDGQYYEKIGKTTKCIQDEIPFEVPKSWVWVRVHDIVQINPKNTSDDDILSAFIPMEKIEASYGSNYTYDVVKWGTIKKNFTHFANGDVAFAKITPCFQNRKSVVFEGLPNGIGAGTTELKVLRQYGETINRWYLLYFLKSAYFVEEATFKGTANQQRIVIGYLENKLFPLPPYTEQKRIVEKIEELMPLVERYTKAQEGLDKLNEGIKGKLRASILQEAIRGKLVPQDANDEPAIELLKRMNPKFTPPECEEELPRGWSWCSIKDMGDIVTGSTPPKANKEYYDGNIPFFKPTDLEQGRNVCTSKDHLSLLGFEKSRQLPPNSILVTCIGATIGKTGMTSIEGTCNQQINAIIPHKEIFPPYIYYVCNSDFFQYKIKNNASATTLPILNKNKFGDLKFPLPPLAEQKRIVEKIDELFAILDNIEKL